MRKFHLSALSLLAALVFVTGCGDDKAAGPVEAPVQNQNGVVDLDAKTLAPALRAIAWDVSDAEKHGLIITQKISASLVAADAQFTAEEKEHYNNHVAALTATRDALNLKIVASNGDADSVAALTVELTNFRKEADEFEAEVLKARDDFAAANPNAMISNVRSTNELTEEVLSPELAQRLVLAKSFDLDEETQVDRDAVADRADLQVAVAELDAKLLNARKAIRTGANDAETLQKHVLALDEIRAEYVALKTKPTPEAIEAAKVKQAELVTTATALVETSKTKVTEATTTAAIADKKAVVDALVAAEKEAEDAHAAADKAKAATAKQLVDANALFATDASEANKEAAAKALTAAEAAVKAAEEAVTAKAKAVEARTAAQTALTEAEKSIKDAEAALKAAEEALANTKANPVKPEAPVTAPAK
jgi:trimeric autotransporter adhesin